MAIIKLLLFVWVTKNEEEKRMGLSSSTAERN